MSINETVAEFYGRLCRERDDCDMKIAMLLAEYPELNGENTAGRPYSGEMMSSIMGVLQDAYPDALTAPEIGDRVGPLMRTGRPASLSWIHQNLAQLKKEGRVVDARNSTDQWTWTVKS